MVAYKKRKNATAKQDPWPAVRLEEGRVLWRDSLALVQSLTDERERPKALTWLADLASEYILSREQRLAVDVLGLSFEQYRVLFFRHERLPLPVAYLTNETLTGHLAGAVADAETIGNVLIGSSRRLAEQVLIPDWDDLSPADQQKRLRDRRKVIDDLRNHLAPEHRFWPRLDAPFRKLMVQLAEHAALAETDQALAYERTQNELSEWRRTLWREADEAFAETVSGLSRAGRNLKAVAVAQRLFRGRLRNQLGDLFPTRDEAADDEEEALDTAR